MEQVVLIVFLGLAGATLGSFAGAQVWRLRARQLAAEKQAGEKVDQKEFKRLKPLLEKRVKDDRSRCLSCGHKLRWYDLAPVISWLSLRGRCRYCRASIGWWEILLEVGLGSLFVLSYIFWPGSLANPLELVKFVAWLIALVAMAVNFVYDARWLLLVPILNWLLIGLGLLYATISALQSADPVGVALSTIGAVLLLGGLYWLLWLVSRGRWVGEGDMYIGAGLALFLGGWQLGFVALFAANLIGTVLIAPGLFSGKIGKGSQVPFGPLLIAGGVLTWFVGDAVVRWYQSLLFF